VLSIFRPPIVSSHVDIHADLVDAFPTLNILVKIGDDVAVILGSYMSSGGLEGQLDVGEGLLNLL
jgi:hypothetical protein